MCEEHGHVHVPPVEAIPADAEWRGEVLSLEPVDEVSVLIVCDNSVDVLLLDQGPARRLRPPDDTQVRPAATVEGYEQ